MEPSARQPHPPTRDEALALLREFNRSASLLNHALAVEAVMRRIAHNTGADEDTWGLVGLVHDLDYECASRRHCRRRRSSRNGMAGPLIRPVHPWMGDLLEVDRRSD